MTDERALFIVRFGRADDGGSGDLIDCTRVNEIGGLSSFPIREGVATGTPANPGINVAVFAASEREAITEARTRGDAYGRSHRGSA